MARLLLLAALASSAEAALYADTLLAGVTSVPRIGWPARLIACGANVQGVVTGNTPSDVPMAAATYGKGKVIAFSHDAYAKGFRDWARKANVSYLPNKLFENMQGWLKGTSAVTNKDLGSNEIVEITGSTTVQSVNWTTAKTIVWAGGQANLSDSTMEYKLTTWIRGGGGLVVGHTFWAISFPNAMDRLLRSFGINIRRGYVYTAGPDHLIVANSKHAYASVASMIKRISPNMTEDESDGLTSLWYCEPTDETLRAAQTAYLLNFNNITFTPSAAKIVTTPPAKAMVRVVAFISEHGAFSRATPPGIEHLPGTFAQDPPISEVTVEVRASSENKYTPIGYYAKPATPFKVERLSVTDDKKVWQIKLNPQTSILNDHNKRFKRYPNIHQIFDISAASNEFVSAYGGPIFVYSPPGSKNETIKLKLSKVVKSPYLDTQNNATVAEWETRKNAPGLWADLCGEFICFSLPSAIARKIADPVKVLKDWDEVAWSRHYLRGEGWSIRDRPAEWVMHDVDGWGYMWAGYPIGGVRDYSITQGDALILEHFDVGLVKGDGNKTGSEAWGMFHELGHRAEKGSWSFQGEVTVNIFTLFAYEYKYKIPQWEHPRNPELLKERLKWLNNVRVFDKHDPWSALAPYQQLAHEFGWGSLMKIFREYEPITIHDNDKKIEEWIIRFSKMVNLNLIPLFELWAYPISDVVKNTLAGYTPFYPNDVFTQGCPNCTESLMAKYPNAVRSASHINVSYPDVIPPAVIPAPYVKFLS